MQLASKALSTKISPPYCLNIDEWFLKNGRIIQFFVIDKILTKVADAALYRW